jgi:hypothetical protein
MSHPHLLVEWKASEPDKILGISASLASPTILGVLADTEIFGRHPATAEMEDQGLLPRMPSDSLQQAHFEGERGAHASPGDLCPAGVDEDIFFDWEAFYGNQAINTGFAQDRTSWSTLDSLTSTEPSPTPFLGGEEVFREPPIFSQHDAVFSRNQMGNAPILPSNFNNVAEWLDGAYRPPKPCDHCRRHRLQCLILRRTPDNPNPVPSCSSCVGLFRPCSFGRGEKRQASRFETLTPVMGHLHGLPEEAEGNVGADGSSSWKWANIQIRHVSTRN